MTGNLFPDRRGLLRGMAFGFGAAAGSMSGWLHTIAGGAEKKLAKSVIVLWLNGGPSTIDLWDLKPGHENGGPFREITTTAAGLRISEHLPRLATWGNQLSLVRSMSTREGDHARAYHLLRSGYAPQGALRYPAVGAVLARELGKAEADLPNFVSIAPARYSVGGGFLGPRFDPLVLGEAGGSVTESLTVPDLVTAPGVTSADLSARLRLLDGMEQHFPSGRTDAVAEDIRAATARAVKLMRPEAAAAFNLDQEKAKTREAYGRNLFGQGCLLARRLVERRVPFVEVTLDGWDTHQSNFGRVKELSGTLDAAFSTLLADLKDKGLLDSTLVVCQGEFGRTPRINASTGRDHWPASWAVALAGGGVRPGQVVGRTTRDGMAVDGPAVSVPDLIATVLRACGIDPTRQNMSNVGRPIRLAAPAARPIKELL